MLLSHAHHRGHTASCQKGGRRIANITTTRGGCQTFLAPRRPTCEGRICRLRKGHIRRRTLTPIVTPSGRLRGRDGIPVREALATFPIWHACGSGVTFAACSSTLQVIPWRGPIQRDNHSASTPSASACRTDIWRPHTDYHREVRRNTRDKVAKRALGWHWPSRQYTCITWAEMPALTIHDPRRRLTQLGLNLAR
jgi:hypothetical protein